MQEFNNDIIVIAEDKKKKGAGISAVLSLMKDFLDFQDKVNAAAEAQDIAENKAKIEAFNDQIISMYKVLSEMAEGAITAMRAKSDEVEAPVEEAPVVEERVEATTTVDVPRAPSM